MIRKPSPIRWFVVAVAFLVFVLSIYVAGALLTAAHAAQFVVTND